MLLWAQESHSPVTSSMSSRPQSKKEAQPQHQCPQTSNFQCQTIPWWALTSFSAKAGSCLSRTITTTTKCREPQLWGMSFFLVMMTTCRLGHLRVPRGGKGFWVWRDRPTLVPRKLIRVKDLLKIKGLVWFMRTPMLATLHRWEKKIHLHTHKHTFYSIFFILSFVSLGSSFFVFIFRSSWIKEVKLHESGDWVIVLLLKVIDT